MSKEKKSAAQPAVESLLADLRELVSEFREKAVNDDAHGGDVNRGGAIAWSEAADDVQVVLDSFGHRTTGSALNKSHAKLDAAVARLPVPLLMAVNGVANAFLGSTVYLCAADGSEVTIKSTRDAWKDAPCASEPVAEVPTVDGLHTCPGGAAENRNAYWDTCKACMARYTRVHMTPPADKASKPPEGLTSEEWRDIANGREDDETRVKIGLLPRTAEATNHEDVQPVAGPVGAHVPVEGATPSRTPFLGTASAIPDDIELARAFLAGWRGGGGLGNMNLDMAAKELADLFSDVRRSASARQERMPLTHVAVRLDGVVWSLPKPFRHHHILEMIHHLGVKWNDGEDKDQGFLDSEGRYLTRKQAWVNADLHGQIKNGKIIGGVLTSEDLW